MTLGWGAGSWPAVVKSVPATAVTFGVYELAKAALLREPPPLPLPAALLGAERAGLQ